VLIRVSSDSSDRKSLLLLLLSRRRHRAGMKAIIISLQVFNRHREVEFSRWDAFVAEQLSCTTRVGTPLFKDCEGFRSRHRTEQRWTHDRLARRRQENGIKYSPSSRRFTRNQ